MSEEFPEPSVVAAEFRCLRSACQTPEECWVAGSCLLVLRRGRFIDRGAAKKKFREDDECRVCGNFATDAHHVLYRSRGGDDVTENIIPLCHDCHMALHFSAGPDYEEVRRAIGESLREEEVAYVLRRLGPTEGAAFLERHYYRKDENADQPQPHD